MRDVWKRRTYIISISAVLVIEHQPAQRMNNVEQQCAKIDSQEKESPQRSHVLDVAIAE